MADEGTTTGTETTNNEPGAQGGESTELSAEDLRAALAAARKEAAGYRTKLREAEPFVTKAKQLEDANKSDVEKLTAQLQEANARGETSTRELQQLRAAMKAGLDIEFADRLRGSTPEELEADAKKLAERFGTPKAPAATAKNKPVPALSAGASPTHNDADETDPLKLADRINRRSPF